MLLTVLSSFCFLSADLDGNQILSNDIFFLNGNDDGKGSCCLQLLVMPLRRYRDNEAKLSGGLKVLKRIEQ